MWREQWRLTGKAVTLEQLNIARLLTNRIEIGIRIHVNEVVVAQPQRFVQHFQRRYDLPQGRKTASEIVAGVAVAWTQRHQVQIKLERPLVVTTICHQVNQLSQHVDAVAIPRSTAS